MIYRGPGLLVVVLFSSSPTPFPPLPSVSSTGDTHENWERETMLLGGEGEGRNGGRAQSTTKKAWSSINLSIISGPDRLEQREQRNISYQRHLADLNRTTYDPTQTGKVSTFSIFPSLRLHTLLGSKTDIPEANP